MDRGPHDPHHHDRERARDAGRHRAGRRVGGRQSTSAAAVGVGPAGTQQVVVVVVPTEAPRRPDLARAALAERVRAAASVDVAAVLVVPALPVDKRHNSKIDRTRVGRVGGARARRRTDARAVKVLVTGATSLLGGAVARTAARPRRRRHRVPAPAERTRDARGPRRRRRPRAVEAAVAGADVVIHAAAKVAVVGPWSELRGDQHHRHREPARRGARASGRPVRLRVVAVGRPRGPFARRRAGRAGRPRPARATTTRAARRPAELLALAAGTGRLLGRRDPPAPRVGARATRNSSVASSTGPARAGWRSSAPARR